MLGNHEFESGKADEVQKILNDGGILLLDGDACEVEGIGFAGVKGFAGGFGERVLAPWGEAIMKQFVHEAVEEALKLESALAKLRTYAPHRVDALFTDCRHRDGRTAGNLSFLRIQPAGRTAQSLFRDRCLSRARASWRPEGKTKTGVPVYNVAMKLLEYSFPGQPPYRILNLPRGDGSSKRKVGSLCKPRLNRKRTTSSTAMCLETLRHAEIPFLISGGFALQHFTGIVRETKDLDFFVLGKDIHRALEALAEAGYPTELTFSHWLGKAYDTEAEYVDLIFSSGNGLCKVTQTWFERAVPSEVFDMPVLLCAPEEMIWQKAFIMERERYDGADIAHLLLTQSETLRLGAVARLVRPALAGAFESSDLV